MRAPGAAEALLRFEHDEARAGALVGQVIGAADAGDAGADDQHVEMLARPRGHRCRHRCVRRLFGAFQSPVRIYPTLAKFATLVPASTIRRAVPAPMPRAISDIRATLRTKRLFMSPAVVRLQVDADPVPGSVLFGWIGPPASFETRPSGAPQDEVLSGCRHRLILILRCLAKRGLEGRTISMPSIFDSDRCRARLSLPISVDIVPLASPAFPVHRAGEPLGHIDWATGPDLCGRSNRCRLPATAIWPSPAPSYGPAPACPAGLCLSRGVSAADEQVTEERSYERYMACRSACLGTRASHFRDVPRTDMPVFGQGVRQTLDDILAQTGEDRVTVKLHLQSQPWHMYSGVIVRCILAASTLESGKEAAKSVMAAAATHREEFEFDRHCSGPNLDATSNDIIRRIERYSNVKVDEPDLALRQTKERAR